jgi:hypothetical protein
VFIIYDRAIDEEILGALSACCIDKYTRWHDASGVGESGPHLGDHIWPALNNVIMTVVESEKKYEILGKIKALQEEFPFVGLRAVVLPVLDMI